MVRTDKIDSFFLFFIGDQAVVLDNDEVCLIFHLPPKHLPPRSQLFKKSFTSPIVGNESASVDQATVEMKT